MATNPNLAHAREVAARVIDRQLHARVDEILTLARTVLATEPQPNADTVEIKAAVDTYSEFSIKTRGDHEKALTAAVNVVLAGRVGAASKQPEPGTQIFVSIGNSDNKLTQREWSRFCDELRTMLTAVSTRVYGWWYSLPDEPYQNMTGSVELPGNIEAEADLLRELSMLAALYRQDSIAYSPTVTQFIKAPAPVRVSFPSIQDGDPDDQHDPAAVDTHLDHIAGHALTGLAHDQNGGAA